MGVLILFPWPLRQDGPRLAPNPDHSTFGNAANKEWRRELAMKTERLAALNYVRDRTWFGLQVRARAPALPQR
jgi:hypothetical protein